MSAQIAELDKLLAQLVAEHNTLAGCMDTHLAAMKRMSADEIVAAGASIELCRTRLVSIENRRRVLVQQIVRINKLPAAASLSDIAAVCLPPAKASLLKRRDELKLVTGLVKRKSLVSAKLAGALAGHMNTVMRLVTGAVQKAAVYTKQGTHKMNARIGVMEAVA
jgi:hypothetical protein